MLVWYLTNPAPQDCHYSITWPSKYGCPVSTSSGGAWSFIWYCILAFAAYIALGMAYNVQYGGANVGVEAVPNIQFWRELPTVPCPKPLDPITYTFDPRLCTGSGIDAATPCHTPYKHTLYPRPKTLDCALALA